MRILQDHLRITGVYRATYFFGLSMKDASFQDEKEYRGGEQAKEGKYLKCQFELPIYYILQFKCVISLSLIMGNKSE